MIRVYVTQDGPAHDAGLDVWHAYYYNDAELHDEPGEVRAQNWRKITIAEGAHDTVVAAARRYAATHHGEVDERPPWSARTAEDLRRRYGGHWGEHPDHSVRDWKGAVGTDDTRLGYWAWVASNLAAEAEDTTGEG